MRTSVTLAGFAWLACTSQAMAGDASCIWNRLPEISRDRVISDYARVGIKGLKLLEIVPGAEFVPLAKACGITSDSAEAAGQAFAYFALEYAAENRLRQMLNLPPGAVDKAWGTLNQKQRSDLAAWVRSAGSRDMPLYAAGTQSLQMFARELGAPEINMTVVSPVGAELINYSTGRTMREYTETKF